MPAEDALRSIAEHLDELRNSGSVSGDPVRLPGDRAAEVESDNEANGVPIPEPLLLSLNVLANRLGINRLT
jgi:LDH2 family malate/lactate/ureidoglycolate dehydrogenase